MGDSRRFDLFAKYIEKHIHKDCKIADAASGKGYLQAALRQLGYKHITSWDKRPKNAKNRIGYRYGHFSWELDERYDCILGMHPDTATDHIIQYAIKNRVMCIVCPCCTKPSAFPFWGPYKYSEWLNHLKRTAEKGNMEVEETSLKMTGSRIVLFIKPIKNP